jgi:hypothetical protein
MKIATLALGALLLAAPAHASSGDGQTTNGPNPHSGVSVFGGKGGGGIGPSVGKIGREVGRFADDAARGLRSLWGDIGRAQMYARYPQITWGEGSPGHGSATINNCGNCR